MPQLIEDDYDITDAIEAERTCRAERRQKMISCLNEIAAEATTALTDAGLCMRVFFSVPSSGEALATFATPGDPSDADWRRASVIICGLVARKLGIEGLRTNELPCAASGVHMGAADIFSAGDYRPDA